MEKTSKFNIPQYVVLFYLLYKVYYISIFSLGQFIRGSESYLIDILFFMIFLITTLDINQLFKFHFSINNSINLFLIFTFLFFLFSALIINIKNDKSIFTFLKLSIYIFQFVAFYFYFAKIMYKDDNLLEKFLDLILYFVVINSFFSILSLHFGFNTENRLFVSAIGIYNNPNTTSFIYSIGIPILVYKLIVNKIPKPVFIILMILFVYCQIFTYSRAGYMATLASLLVLTFFRSKKIFILCVILFVIIFLTYIAEILSLKTLSTVSRVLLTLTAISMITRSINSFLWGYGVLNALEQFDIEKNLFGNFEINVNNPHNFILLIALQFGVMTLIPYLLFIITLIVNNYRKRKSYTNLIRNKVELSIAIILGLIIQNIFEEIIVVPEFPIMPLSLIFMGFLYYAYSLHKKVEKNT